MYNAKSPWKNSIWDDILGTFSFCIEQANLRVWIAKDGLKPNSRPVFLIINPYCFFHIQEIAFWTSRVSDIFTLSLYLPQGSVCMSLERDFPYNLILWMEFFANQSIVGSDVFPTEIFVPFRVDIRGIV